MDRKVEICVTSVESAMAAEAGKADRVELCADRKVGGTTPSPGMIAVACRRLAIPVHVLIRARGGKFVYSSIEVEVMDRDIAEAKSLGASGIVLGALRPDGTIDRSVVSAWIDTARPLSVTFHKAFDATRDPVEALEVLLELGVDRLLTSGGAGATAAAAPESIEKLARLVLASRGRLNILAGGQVRATDLPALQGVPGLTEIHVGSATLDQERLETDPERVREFVQRWKQSPQDVFL